MRSLHFPKNENYFLKVASEEIIVWKRANAKVQGRPDEQQIGLKLKDRGEQEGSWCNWQVGAVAQLCFNVEQDGASE